MVISRLNKGSTQLTNISMPSLNKVGEVLSIQEMELLDNIDFISGISTIGGIKLNELPNVTLLVLNENVTILGFTGHAFDVLATGINSIQAEGLQIISGRLLLVRTTIESMQGFSNLTSIGGDASIVNNQTLISLDGLENLIEVGGEFEISNNTNLIDCCGLKSFIESNGVNSVNISGGCIALEILDTCP